MLSFLNSNLIFQVLIFKDLFKYFYYFSFTDFKIRERVLKEAREHLNTFAIFKLMIVKRTISFFFQKNSLIFPVRKCNALILLYKSPNLKKIYIRFVNFMYSLFYAKALVFFFCMKSEYIDLDSFLEYIYDPKLFNLYKKFSKYELSREVRIKNWKILEQAYKKYRISTTFFFNYTATKYYYNFIKKTGTYTIGFEAGYYRRELYNFTFYLPGIEPIYKHVLIRQICDCYYLAEVQRALMYCKYYIMLGNFFFFNNINVK